MNARSRRSVSPCAGLARAAASTARRTARAGSAGSSPCRPPTADPLFDANALDREERMWTYLFSGPFRDRAEYRDWHIESCAASDDPLFFAIVDQRLGRATGLGSYLRIEPAHGVIEVGHLAFSPLLQRTAGGDRGDVPDDAPGLRARVPALRMEMRCPQCGLATRSGTARLHVRRHLSPGDRHTRDATATPRGTRSSTANGRRSTWSSAAGLNPPISTQTARSVRRFRTARRTRVDRPRCRCQTGSPPRCGAAEYARSGSARWRRR